MHSKASLTNQSFDNNMTFIYVSQSVFNKLNRNIEDEILISGVIAT